MIWSEHRRPAVTHSDARSRHGAFKREPLVQRSVTPQQPALQQSHPELRARLALGAHNAAIPIPARTCAPAACPSGRRPQGLESHRLSPGLSCGNAVRLHRLGHVGLLHVRLDGPEPESLLSRMLLPTLLHTLATKSTRTTKAAALAAAGALGATGAAAAAIIAAELPDELRASKGCLSRVLVRHQRAHLVSA